MVTIKKPQPIIISENDARGARGPQAGSRGDTLVPMLIGAVVLTIIGVGAVFMLAL